MWITYLWRQHSIDHYFCFMLLPQDEELKIKLWFVTRCKSTKVYMCCRNIIQGHLIYSKMMFRWYSWYSTKINFHNEVKQKIIYTFWHLTGRPSKIVRTFILPVRIFVLRIYFIHSKTHDDSDTSVSKMHVHLL